MIILKQHVTNTIVKSNDQRINTMTMLPFWTRKLAGRKYPRMPRTYHIQLLEETTSVLPLNAKPVYMNSGIYQHKKIGEGCVEKPLATLWRNYTQSSRTDVRMQLTVSAGGLKAVTKDHGLTEYWAHRLTTCIAPAQFPRLFCWIYRHEGRRLRHELRCHAVLCSTTVMAKQIEVKLKQSLTLALFEFKRDKLSRQNARLSLANSVYENPTIPRRKILLSTGSHNYKPPLERSKSAPKLTIIEEIIEEEGDSFYSSHKIYKEILKHYDSTSSLLDKRENYIISKLQQNVTSETFIENICDKKHAVSRKSKVKFSNDLDHLILDEKSDMILAELVQNTLRNDLLESCERAWFNALGGKPDLILGDSDEGLLSSGGESTSILMSDIQRTMFPTIKEILEDVQDDEADKFIVEREPNLNFKIGGSVLSQVRSFEKFSNADILKYCGLIYNKAILESDEVSLIPVGESQADFSSLKVYKKRSILEPACVINVHNGIVTDDEDSYSVCSEESGYEDNDIVSSIGNIVLV